MSIRKIPFIKMHGAGNDFVFIDRSETPLTLTKPVIKKIMDRHFGIGADQLMYLKKREGKKIARVSIFNSDGSEAEMCGNGVRAVAAHLISTKGFSSPFTIFTKAGPIEIKKTKSGIEVNMGRPILEGKKIPTRHNGPVINYNLQIKGKTFKIHGVSMGNPHCVIFVKNVQKFPVKEIGPLIENHSFFPNRVNVEFVEKISKNRVRARVWERGAGETLACGTGACAIVVAGARKGLLKRRVSIDLPGGTLGVRWDKNDHVYLTGPTEVSYKGIFLLNA